MIDHVMLMSLKRREDKWYFALGSLHHADFPLDRVIRFHSHDGQDYESTQSVVEAAVADGFPYFGNYDGANNKRRQAYLCWLWTYVSALRQIVQMNERVMLLIDDILPIPAWDWDRLCGLVRQCVEADRREKRIFKGLQLRFECTPDRLLPKIPYYSSMLREGLYSINENGYILSRSGARMFLNEYKDLFPKDIIAITELIARRGITNKRYRSGFWTVLDEVVQDYASDWKNSDLWGV